MEMNNIDIIRTYCVSSLKLQISESNLKNNINNCKLTWKPKSEIPIDLL